MYVRLIDGGNTGCRRIVVNDHATWQKLHSSCDRRRCEWVLSDGVEQSTLPLTCSTAAYWQAAVVSDHGDEFVPVDDYRGVQYRRQGVDWQVFVWTNSHPKLRQRENGFDWKQRNVADPVCCNDGRSDATDSHLEYYRLGMQRVARICGLVLLDEECCRKNECQCCHDGSSMLSGWRRAIFHHARALVVARVGTVGRNIASRVGQ